MRTRWRDYEYEALVWLRTWLRLGLRLTDLQIAAKDPEDNFHATKERWLQQRGFLRIGYQDLYEDPPVLLEELKERAPEVMRAPPSYLDAIAQQIEEDGRGEWNPRLLFTTSERLEDAMRESIERAFGAPVQEIYGATEAGCIAWRCRQCGAYHGNSDTVVLDVVDAHGNPVPDGEVGEVVVTNLFSRGTVFLRYLLGDLARVDRASTCPRALDQIAIRELVGRTVDRLFLISGAIASPYQFMPDEIPGVIEYQIVQERVGHVRVDVVPNEHFDRTVFETARAMWIEEMEDDVEIDYALVDSIPVAPGEKFRRVISLLKDDPS